MMNNALQVLCERMAENREILKNTLRWENDVFYPVSANLFCARGVTPDAGELIAARDLLKARTGVFSNFRGYVKLPLIALLSLSREREAFLGRVLSSYQLLKQRFITSDYLALAACFLAETPDEAERERLVSRARDLYERMKKEHRFLTGAEDSPYAVLLAASDRSDDELIADMEESYALLKTVFRDSNSVQTVSHVLALDRRVPKEKAARVADLYDTVRQAGGKYSRYKPLAVLASLAMADADIRLLADELMEAEADLHERKGWRGIFGFDRATRMMHAAMLVTDLHLPGDTGEKAAMNAALSAAIAQQMAVCMAATSAAAASAAAASSH